jgi:hypothetical protein
VWGDCYALLGEIDAGTETQPVTPADLVALLRAMVWPLVMISLREVTNAALAEK